MGVASFKMIGQATLLLVVLSAASASNEAYCRLRSYHTMCLYPGPSKFCGSATRFRGLTEDAKTAILDRHNMLRAKVANGQEPGQPAAANMQKLVWNTELETIAQRWADQCEFGHDNIYNRVKLDKTSIQQNVYMMRRTWDEPEPAVQASMAGAVQNWYDEVTDPGFNPALISPFVHSRGYGHYTQMVWADTTEVGCGLVNFLGKYGYYYTTLLVCNYAKAGNIPSGTVYQKGPACSACNAGQTCDNGLCV